MSDFDLRPARDHGLAPLERLRSPRRESGLGLAVVQTAWAVGCRAYFHVWHRLRVIGADRLPTEPPFVICANHVSHLDALALAAPLPLWLRDRVYSLAAGDVFFEDTATTVFAASCVNALPVWRRKTAPRALRELRDKLLTEPAGFILFPEGARSRDGNPRRFRAGIGALVAGTTIPMIPCHLDGPLAAMPPGTKLPRRVRITIRVGEPLRFSNVPDEKAGWERVASAVEVAVHAASRR